MYLLIMENSASCSYWYGNIAVAQFVQDFSISLSWNPKRFSTALEMWSSLLCIKHLITALELA